MLFACLSYTLPVLYVSRYCSVSQYKLIDFCISYSNKYKCKPWSVSHEYAFINRSIFYILLTDTYQLCSFPGTGRPMTSTCFTIKLKWFLLRLKRSMWKSGITFLVLKRNSIHHKNKICGSFCVMTRTISIVLDCHLLRTWKCQSNPSPHTPPQKKIQKGN